MPNAFLGFPVSRAKVALIALSYAGIQSVYDDPGYLLSEWFTSLDGIYRASSPADGVTLTETQLSLSTQGGGTDFASVSKTPANFLTPWSWAKRAKFKTEALLAANTDSLPKIDLLWGDHDTGRHFGFTVRAGLLKGSVANGTTETLTATLADWGAAGYYELHRLEAIYNITSVDFYLDGVKVATISTGLPTGDTAANRFLRLYVRANASTNYHGMTLSFWKAWKEA